MELFIKKVKHFLIIDSERRSIMKSEDKGRREADLVKLCKKYGLSTNKRCDGTMGSSEPELISRIIEGERALKESRQWVVNLIIALAALASAIGAWYH